MIRNGDIEALRNKMKLEGKPIKSDIIRDKDGTQYFYDVTKRGNVEIKDEVKSK